MRYFIFVKSAEGAFGRPPPALMGAIAALGQEAAAAGVLVDTGGLMPSAMSARARVQGGKLTITDGPFTESKEVIGGYACYDVASKEEAIFWTRRFMDAHLEHWPQWEGESEIRPIMDMPGPPR